MQSIFFGGGVHGSRQKVGWFRIHWIRQRGGQIFFHWRRLNHCIFLIISPQFKGVSAEGSSTDGVEESDGTTIGGWSKNVVSKASGAIDRGTTDENGSNVTNYGYNKDYGSNDEDKKFNYTSLEIIINTALSLFVSVVVITLALLYWV